MRFLGIDFGWLSGPSGLAALTWDGSALRVDTLERTTGLEDVLAWTAGQAGDRPALVAVDAPLVIPNQTGMRVPDRLTHIYFGRYHAGCYPGNRSRPFAEQTVELGCRLQALGFAHADHIVPRQPGRYQIEVFPHPALVSLFGLDHIIRYKKGRLGDRRGEMARYRSLLADVLPGLTPPLEAPDLPPIPAGGAALKDIEDRLDALICAYVGAHWWYWGVERNQVLGSAADGYIVVPGRASADGWQRVAA